MILSRYMQDYSAEDKENTCPKPQLLWVGIDLLVVQLFQKAAQGDKQ